MLFSRYLAVFSALFVVSAVALPVRNGSLSRLTLADDDTGCRARSRSRST